MADMLSPGVYVSEMDYSEYVQSASTCILGMVGGARRGPIGVPTLVTNQAQMIEIFGKPSDEDYGVYSALASLTNASQLYYVRVAPEEIVATAGDSFADPFSFQAISGGADFNGITIAVSNLIAETFDVTVTPLEGAPETYTGMTLGTIGTNINGTSKYVVVNVHALGTGTLAEKTFTLAGGQGGLDRAMTGQLTVVVDGVETLVDSKLLFTSKNPDSTLTGCKVSISKPDANGYFDVAIVDGTTVLESWVDVQAVSELEDRYVENFINTKSKRVECVVSEIGEIREGKLTFVGGQDGLADISNSDVINGLEAFADVDGLDVDVLSAPGRTDREVITAGLSVCEGRGDSLFVADPPFALGVQEVIAWSNAEGEFEGGVAFDSSYGALYWPWVKVADSYTKSNKWMPPSGYVLGQFASNDAQGSPWLAPAGLTRGLLTKPIGIEVSANPAERDALYGNRNIVNPLVNFMRSGIAIWGQKTMQRKPSALDRINVRRLMNYLKKVIGVSTKYFVFEQNDEVSWDRWVDMVEPVLRDIKYRGGVYDYQIEVLPTETDIENNRMPVTVRIRPTKTTEFIPLTFMVMPNTASFEN